jgi:hypothetical protein
MNKACEYIYDTYYTETGDGMISMRYYDNDEGKMNHIEFKKSSYFSEDFNGTINIIAYLLENHPNILTDLYGVARMVEIKHWLIDNKIIDKSMLPIILEA